MELVKSGVMVNGLSVMKVLMSWNHLYYTVLQIMI